MKQWPDETMVEKVVTYTAEVDGRVILIRNVPARVCVETGEQFFAPQTVERIHAIVSGRVPAVASISTPVYDFAA
jgi:YgiT-type zinc finger domain-containing protein